MLPNISNHAVFIHDAITGEILDANRSAVKIFGFNDSEEMIQTGFGGLLFEISPYSFQDAVEKIHSAAEGIPLLFKWLLRHKTGNPLWLKISLHYVFLDGMDLVLAIERNVLKQTKNADINDSQKKKPCIPPLKKRPKGFGGMIGKSPVMLEVYDFIFKASSTNASVLIYGESGTGKELAARAIHNMSRRSGNSLIPVNCGALPDNLFESQFFGYRKGAFTGADKDMAGFLDMADQGTLFLDEIGNIDLKNQVRLLRGIDRGEYIPVGGTEIKKSDFRLISATNSDLAKEVRQGRMRSDFFYRIHVMPIKMPSLRERTGDIPLLVNCFLEKYAEYGPHKYLSEDMFSRLLNYNWPGSTMRCRRCPLPPPRCFPALRNSPPWRSSLGPRYGNLN